MCLERLRQGEIYSKVYTMDIMKQSNNPPHTGFAWFGCIRVAYAICKMHKSLFKKKNNILLNENSNHSIHKIVLHERFLCDFVVTVPRAGLMSLRWCLVPGTWK